MARDHDHDVDGGGMRIREAGPADGPMLVAFFRETPIAAGTTFAFDRGPDFFALLRAQGEHRTLMMHDHGRLVGTATVLWHDARDRERVVRVGEVRDLRLAPAHRGGRSAWRLLAAVHDVLRELAVDAVVSLVSDANRDAIPLASGRVGLLRLPPTTRYLSAHYLGWRAPQAWRAPWRVTPATDGDGEALMKLFEPERRALRFDSVDGPIWPDPSGRSRAWLARDRRDRPVGALLLWDGEAVRRIRVTHYAWREWPLRLLSHAAGLMGVMVPLPPPGGVLRTWASRGFAVESHDPRLVRALLGAALGAAARSGRHVVQLNLRASDPLIPLLPSWPRSLHHSTVYAGPLHADPRSPSPTGDVHADIALA